jgi:hypothetical protein
MNFKKHEPRIIKDIQDGAYDVKIDRVFMNYDKNNMRFKLKLGNEILFLTLFMKTKIGKENSYTSAHINDLLIIFDLDEILDKNGYFLALDNREIGVLIKMSQYNGYKNIELIKFYDVDTGKTAYELENNLPATWLDKKIVEMEA